MTAETKTYQCERCRGVFDTVDGDERADAEAKDLWGVDNASHDPTMSVICDDCFKAFMNWYQTAGDGDDR